MMGMPATGRSFEYVTPNIGRFADGKAAEHWADQGDVPVPHPDWGVEQRPTAERA
jgi:hypothetical protein